MILSLDRKCKTELDMLNKPVQIKLCPIISRPMHNCYCASTNSMYVESTIIYCGGNYEQCSIYEQLQSGNDAL